MNLLIVVDMQKDFIDGSLGTACLLYTSQALLIAFGLSMTDQMQFIGDHIDSFSFVRVRPDSRKIYHKYNRNPSVNQSSTSIPWDFPELSTVL